MNHHAQEHFDTTEQWLDSLSSSDDEKIDLPASLLADILAHYDREATPSGKSAEQLAATIQNSDATWQERVAALQEIATSGTQAPLDQIIHVLKHDPHEAVRMAAIRTLGAASIDTPISLYFFRIALHDARKEVRATALQVLKETQNSQIQQALSTEIVACLEDDELLHLSAIPLIGSWGTHTPTQLLIQELQHPSPLVRAAAALALGNIRPWVHIPTGALARALYDNEQSVREAATLALGDQLPIEMLVYDLQRGDVQTRIQAARILGELGEITPLEHLIHAALEDVESTVRRAAVLALGKQPRTPAEPLIEATRDYDRIVREAAELVLYALHPDIAHAQEAEAESTYTEYFTQKQHKRGTRIGNYILTQQLGKGQKARVYKGIHASEHTPVAIKVLDVQLSPQQQQRFVEEARTLSQLQHPAIARILYADTTYLVTEYVDGGSLRQHYPRGKQASLTTILPYIRQAASALHYAHNLGIVHRDVKPSNILLNEHNQAILTDFGITALEQATVNPYKDTDSSNLPYMAPELFYPYNTPTPASDQYALAVVAYELLSGEPPMPRAMLSMRSRPPFPSLSQVQAHEPLPPAVEQVLASALASDPAARYESIAAFSTALEAAARSGSFTPPIAPMRVTPTDQQEQGHPAPLKRTFRFITRMLSQLLALLRLSRKE